VFHPISPTRPGEDERSFFPSFAKEQIPSEQNSHPYHSVLLFDVNHEFVFDTRDFTQRTFSVLRKRTKTK